MCSNATNVYNIYVFDWNRDIRRPSETHSTEHAEHITTQTGFHTYEPTVYILLSACIYSHVEDEVCELDGLGIAWTIMSAIDWELVVAKYISFVSGRCCLSDLLYTTYKYPRLLWPAKYHHTFMFLAPTYICIYSCDDFNISGKPRCRAWRTRTIRYSTLSLTCSWRWEIAEHHIFLNDMGGEAILNSPAERVEYCVRARFGRFLLRH